MSHRAGFYTIYVFLSLVEPAKKKRVKDDLLSVLERSLMSQACSPIFFKKGSWFNMGPFTKLKLW